MKKVLSLLVAFILMQTQTWALVGGPFDGGGASDGVVGSYAGVMIGNVVIGPTAGTAALGIFTLGVPSVGIGQGAFAVFVGGITVIGDVVALGDPDLLTIQGVMTGDYTYTQGFGTETVTLGAQFSATVLPGKGGNKFTGGGARIVGTASATTIIPFEGTFNGDFVVTGFKQSNDGGVPADLTSIGQSASS